MNVEQGSCVYITNALPDLAVVIVIVFDSGIYVIMRTGGFVIGQK